LAPPVCTISTYQTKQDTLVVSGFASGGEMGFLFHTIPKRVIFERSEKITRALLFEISESERTT